MRRTLAVVLGALATVALASGVARAEEPKSNPRSLLFDIGAPRGDQRAQAFDEALREAGPAPISNGVLQPDGSVRYGATTVTVSVRNPCPPTDPTMMHDDVPPLPGRRARR